MGIYRLFNIIRHKIDYFIKGCLCEGSYISSVFTLITGTVIAQLIPILVSPIMSRVFTPEDFGLFALFMSIVSILSVIATGRYELAIMLPEEDSDGVNLASLSILLSAAFSIILLAIIVLFRMQIISLFSNNILNVWMWLIPISVFLVSAYQCINYWVNRRRRYKQLSVNRVIQSTSIAISSLSIGLLIYREAGLIAGQVFGQVISMSILVSIILHEDSALLKFVRKEKMKELASRYKRFPKYLVFAHLLNASSAQLPIILLTALYNPTISGHFSLTQKVLAAPLVIIGKAFGDVFREKASMEFIKSGECRGIYQKTLKYLFFVSIIPFTVLFFIAPKLFSIVFGSEWYIAGQYARIMVIMLFIQFIASPLSYMFMIAEKQSLDLIWQIVLFVIAFTSIFMGYYIFDDPIYSILFFTISYSIMYSINLYMTYRFAWGKKDGIKSSE